MESWPKDTDGVAEDTKVGFGALCPTSSAQAVVEWELGCSAGARVALSPLCPPQPMLSSNTGKPDSGAENCTVHIMGNSPQQGEPVPSASPSPSPVCVLGVGSMSPFPWPGRKRPAQWLLLHTLGHVIMKQSYVCALIAMMVSGGTWGDTLRPDPMRMAASCLPVGVEHHLPQLADLRVAALVLPHLDGAEPASLRHALLAVPAALWHRSLHPAVHLERGAGL